MGGGASQPETEPQPLPKFSKDSSFNSLRCFECKNFLTYLPITLYGNLGNLCGRCTPYVSSLTTIDPNIQGIRNTALETLMKLTELLPCRWERCTHLMTYTDIPIHEAECEFREYKCPTIGLNCEWCGPLLELHFMTMHPDYMVYEEGVELNLTTDVTQHMFVEKYNKSFILRVKFDKYVGCICFILFHFQQLDSLLVAKKFFFTLKLSNIANTREYKETIDNQYCVGAYDDRFDWNEDAMFEINLDKIAHLVKCDSTIKYSIEIGVLDG